MIYQMLFITAAAAATATTSSVRTIYDISKTAATPTFSSSRGTGHVLGRGTHPATEGAAAFLSRQAAKAAVAFSSTKTLVAEGSKALPMLPNIAKVCTRSSACTKTVFNEGLKTATGTAVLEKIGREAVISKTKTAFTNALGAAASVAVTAVEYSLQSSDHNKNVVAVKGALQVLAGAGCGSFGPLASVACSTAVGLLADQFKVDEATASTSAGAASSSSAASSSGAASSSAGATSSSTGAASSSAAASSSGAASSSSTTAALTADGDGDGEDERNPFTTPGIANATATSPIGRARDELRRLMEAGLHGGDLRRALIRFIISDNRNDVNRLQVSRDQNAVLRAFREFLGIPHLEWNSHWFDLMGDGNVLFDGLSDEVREDQRNRARALVERMIATRRTVLRTMDGHGRFLYSFLEALRARGENMDNYDIELMDIHAPTDAWHRLFFPIAGDTPNVHPIQGDILEFQPGDFHETFSTSTMLYMNFCGLGDLVRGRLREFLEIWQSNRHDVFLSWSVRNVQAGTPAYWFARWIRSHGDYVSHRGNFFTYHLDW